jgi:hypothetical protein
MSCTSFSEKIRVSAGVAWLISEREPLRKIGFRVGHRGFAMEIEVRVSLIDLKRAFRRLSARLPDESEAGGDFIDFNASEKTLEIAVGGTFEVLNATVVHSGQAKVPCFVFRGIARTLRFYRGKFITIAFLAGALRIDRTAYRHSSISVLAPCRGHALVGTKPAKLQNP